MGSGAARKRASRQNAKVPKTSSQAATWGSSNATPPGFYPASRAQQLHGWPLFPKKDLSFTLNQEARNTHKSAWNESNRLRDNAIQFVSGGKLSQADPDRNENQEDIETVQYEVEFEAREKVSSIAVGQINRQTIPPEQDVIAGVSGKGEELPITRQVEQMGLSTVDHGSSFTQRRSLSPSSQSSGEVILFTGRGNLQKKRKQSSTPPTPLISTPPSPRSKYNDKGFSPQPAPAIIPSRLNADAVAFVPIQTTEPTSRYPLRSQGVLAQGGWTKSLDPSTTQGPKQSSMRQQKQGQSTLLEDYVDEEEILRDYIENVKANHELDEDSSDKSESDRPRTKFTPEKGIVRVIESTLKPEVKITHPDNDWSSEDLRDFDDLNTSEDEPIEIGGVFSRRERPSGFQYLVTPPGQTADFAKWILREKLISTNAKELILAFEEVHPEHSVESKEDEDEDDGNQWDDLSSEDSDDEAINDLLHDQESEHEENERILNQTSRMTDAELARILNKQAELGIDGDDVVLFDDAVGHKRDFIPFSNKTHTSNRTRAKRNRRSKGTFPSAEAFADVLDEDPYNGFDVMDFERPSLKPKKKGRNSANGLPFELEDDELAEQLTQSWENDRSKKAAKKAEREELRQAGLLGTKSGKGRVDLQSKYKNSGMDMDQVKAEVRAFLLDDHRDALALASMNSPQRAQVHLLARALHLKSHSQGKGDTRFPILTKTPFSGSYDEDTITQIDALLAKRKFSAHQWGSKRDKKAAPGAGGGKTRRSGGGGVAAGATYMDGDVVGASAPELGSENRGRAMLERMGWSSGMGIGKVGNKGSVEVIKHVVKNSKAGLG